MKDQLHKQGYKQGKRCTNEEEKRERYLAAQRRYSSKPWTCEFCKYTGTNKNKTNHLRTNRHKNNEKKELDV